MNKPIYDYFSAFIITLLLCAPAMIGTIFLMCILVDVFFYVLFAIPAIIYSVLVCFIVAFETFKTRCFITNDRVIRETRKIRSEILRKDIQLIALIDIGGNSRLYVIYPKGYPKNKIDQHFSAKILNMTRQSLIRNDSSLVSFAYGFSTEKAMRKFGYKPTKRVISDGYGMWGKPIKIIELDADK